MIYFSTEPQWQKDLIKELAEQFGIDIRVARSIAYYPYLFTSHKINDEDNERGIRHRHLGLFAIKEWEKKAAKKENETKN